MSKVLFTNPISDSTKLGELIKLGLISKADIKKWNNKIERDAKRKAKKAQIAGIKDVITNLIGSELFAESKYWSVRQSNNSKGFIEYMDGVERHHTPTATAETLTFGAMGDYGAAIGQEQFAFRPESESLRGPRRSFEGDLWGY